MRMLRRVVYWLLPPLLLAPGHRARAQVGISLPADTLFYEATDERRVASATDSAGTCTELLRWGPHQGLLRTYYPSGALARYVPYGDIDQGVRHGHASDWYENGQLHRLQPYVGGRREGLLLCYYEDGRLRRQTQYTAGRELPGLCYDESGQPVAYFPYEHPPLYPGGNGQFTKELNERARIRLPTVPLVLAQLASFLEVSFWVDEAGRLRQPRVEVPSMLPAFDQAVVRALEQLSRAWVPGQRDGRPAAFTYRLRLPLNRAAGTGYLWYL